MVRFGTVQRARVAFEEGTCAAWLHDRRGTLLDPHNTSPVFGKI
jgi:hypothetical protein